MYSQMLAGMAAERVSDMRREATGTWRARRARPTRPGHAGHRSGHRAAASGPEARLMLRTARP